MRTFVSALALTSITLSCVTASPAINRKLTGKAAVRNVFAELAVPGIEQAGASMGSGQNEIVRGEKSLTLKGKAQCVEQSYVGEALRVKLSVDLRWVDARELDKLVISHVGQGADLSSACDKIMDQHGAAITAQVKAKTEAAFGK